MARKEGRNDERNILQNFLEKKAENIWWIRDFFVTLHRKQRITQAGCGHPVKLAATRV
jgi:hypothetical protein